MATKATKRITYHCSECGEAVRSEGLTVDEAMVCPAHPRAIIDSVQSAAATLGRRGGKARTARKTTAARANGAKGGRPAPKGAAAKARALGEADGYEAACDAEREGVGANYGGGIEREPLAEMTAANGATAWDEGLINALGTTKAREYLGSLSRAALAAYNEGATAGWNRRVRELTEA